MSFTATVDFCCEIVNGQIYSECGTNDLTPVFENFNVKYEIVNECGLSGWPEIAFIGSYKNVINLLNEFGFDEEEILEFNS